MINRREFLGTTLGAGATLAFSPALLRAMRLPAGKLIQRAIPSTGEMLPIISYGPRPTDGAAIKEVLQTLAANGGKVVDVLHGGPPGEQGARSAASELGIANKFFWTTPLSVSTPVLPGFAGPPIKPDAAAVRAAMEEKFAAFKTPMIDLVMVSIGADMPSHIAVLQEMKKQGRIRYIGVHALAPSMTSMAGAPPVYSRLESIMRDEPIDFIGIDYSAGDSRIEASILPLAMERKIGVMAYFPFDRRRIFERASSTPLPAWAAEFEATTWAQFFLKYVASHPAVTVVRTGTTKSAHMLDNIGGGIGKLPNEAMRKRMADLVDSFPPTPAPAPPPQQRPPQGPPVVLSAAVLDRYVGEYLYVASGQTVTIRRDGDRLLMKIAGNAPEGPLAPRSETRFQGPFGLIVEFSPNPSGQANSAVVEQGPFLIPLQRKS